MAVAVPPLLWPREERFATAPGARQPRRDRSPPSGPCRDRDLLANKLQNSASGRAGYDVGEVSSRRSWSRAGSAVDGAGVMGRQPNPRCRTDRQARTQHRFPSPVLGQHNEAVLRGVLGRSDEIKPCAPTA
jgi:hypothetical protein